MDNFTDGYRILEEIGRGSSGTVYRAIEVDTDREVSIKIISRQRANHPDFIRRFDKEARIIGRLEHPHIVPLYTYRRQPDKAYFIMRYLRGHSLRERLSTAEQFDIPLAARMLGHLCEALAYAHKRHIVHGDLKPGNILLDDDKNFYVADFSIVLDLTTTIQIGGTGTPTYAAPEQWRGEPITPQTDIYSLGIVLYEVLTGYNPFRINDPDELLRRHLHDALPPLGDQRPDLPETIDEVIRQATEKNPAARYPDMESLWLAFHNAIMAAGVSFSAYYQNPIQTLGVPTGILKSDSNPTRNPYKGLRAFHEPDTDDFFGRAALVDQLVARLRDRARFLALVGPSGTGKSSIIQAGLIPALRRGVCPGSENWFIVAMTPGATPFSELENALSSVAVKPITDFMTHAYQDDGYVLTTIRDILPSADSHLMLYIDQFEELFTSVADDEKVHFLNNLVTAVTDPNSPLVLILTLRADFYDRPLHYPAFAELIRSHTEVIVPLTMDELRETIVQPACNAGLVLEDGLVEAIVHDITDQPGALPFLQYALTVLFEQCEDNRLTLRAYHENRGVAGTLNQWADKIYNDLLPHQQDMARQLFLRLVTPDEGVGHTRRRVKRAELSSLLAESGEVAGWQRNVMNTVIDTFSHQRLLTVDYDPVTHSPTVEIAHEALIQAWDRLRGWLTMHSDDLYLQQRIAQAAGSWIMAGKDSSYLAVGTRLGEFEGWVNRTTLALSADEVAYLQASRQQWDNLRAEEQSLKAHIEGMERQLLRRRRQASFLLVIMNVAILITLVASFFGLAEGQKTMDVQQTLVPVQATLTDVIQQISDKQNLNEALRLAALAKAELTNPVNNPEFAALTAIRSLERSYTPLADESLMEASELLYTKQLIPYENAVLGVAFSPAGNYALAVSDQSVQVFKVDGAILVSPAFLTLRHPSGVLTARFSPDSHFIITGSHDGIVRLWDISTGSIIQQFIGHLDAVTSLAFSPDGKSLVTGSLDKTARLWDIASGTMLKLFNGHSDGVMSVSFSPDAKSILTGSLDTTIRLWDIATGQEVRRFLLSPTDPAAAILSVAFSPDGRTILSAGRDHIARLWDVATGKVLGRYIGQKQPINQAIFLPDGTSILTASSDGTTWLWNASSGQVIRQFIGPVSDVLDVAISPDGKTFLTGSADKTLRLWDIDTSPALYSFKGYTSDVSGLAFSPDGKWFVTGSAEHTLWLWNIATGQPQQFKGDSNYVTGAVFSHDGKFILTSSLDATARLWDVQSGKMRREIQGNSTPIYHAVFSPDDTFILTASLDNTVREWDTATGALIHEFKGHTAPVIDVAVSPDGKTALSGSLDKTAILWDLNTGRVLHVLGNHSGGVMSVAFSPDGKLVITGSDDNILRLWDTTTGILSRQFIGHTAGVRGVDFSPDGKTILSGSLDKTARLWDASTGVTLRIFTGHTGGILSVAFSPDGKTILTGSQDKTVRLWDVDYHAWINDVCAHLVRDFTNSERQTLGINDNLPTCLPQ